MNENKYLSQLKKLILSELKGASVKIFLFGSRARGDEAKTSDVDIGFIPGKKFNLKTIVYLKDTIEDSRIPYSIEFVNLNAVSENFRKEVLKDAIIWKD